MEDIIGIIGIIVCAILIWALYYAISTPSRRAKNYAEEGIKLKSNKVVHGFVEGIIVPNKNVECTIAAYDDRIDIMQFDTCYSIPIKRLIGIGYYTGAEYATRKKSVVGRAAIGGMMFGGAGAVVGGMSGSGESKVLKGYKTVIAISYYSRNRDISEISISSMLDTQEYYKFTNIVNGCLQSKIEL